MMKKFPLKLEHPTAIVVGCSDFRFSKAHQLWVEENYGTVDQIFIPGSIIRLVKNQGGSLLNDIEVLLGHKPSIIVLVGHEDCLALRLEAGKLNREEERKLQIKYLHNAAEILKTHIPADITIHLRFASIVRDENDNPVSTIFEEI